MRLIRLKKIACGRVALLSRTSNEGYALAIEGPNRITVGVDAGSDKMDGVTRGFIDTDKAMIPARRDEHQLRSVGRPFFGMILAAHNHLPGLFTAAQRS